LEEIGIGGLDKIQHVFCITPVTKGSCWTNLFRHHVFNQTDDVFCIWL
jgi:hypothetical protein